jgi:RHS repeat-associated protein
VQRTEGVLMGPFGDNFTETLSTLDFTGYAGGFWDSENNGDHFGAREYQSTHGSWLSPDPAGMAAVNIANPQTWNRYAYVGNNPVSYRDPSGLDDCMDASQNVIPDDQGGSDSYNCAIVGGTWVEAQAPANVSNTNDTLPPDIGTTDSNLPDSIDGLDPSAGLAANNTNCGAGQPKGKASIISGNATTSAPTIPLGAAIGGAIDGPSGAFLGGIIGSFFGVGGTVSYVPSTNSWYA